MEPGRTVGALLVCCSAFWVVSSSRVQTSPPPPRCDSRLAFHSEVSSSDGNGDIHLRSLSPWSWRTSTKPNQIPSTIWEAECGSCSGPGAGRDLNSVPIYQNLLVLTRQEQEHCFTASYRSVAVGCTCVWARTAQD